MIDNHACLACHGSQFVQNKQNLAAKKNGVFMDLCKPLYLLSKNFHLCYESLNGTLRLVLSDCGFKQLSDPNASIIYHGNLLFLTMGIMYLPCEQLLLTAFVW